MRTCVFVYVAISYICERVCAGSCMEYGEVYSTSECGRVIHLSSRQKKVHLRLESGPNLAPLHSQSEATRCRSHCLHDHRC